MGLNMWVAVVVFLMVTLNPAVLQVKADATSCITCMNCSEIQTWQETALDALFVKLGMSANLSMYMYPFDDSMDFMNRFGGYCTDMSSAGETLAVSGTKCFTLYFTLRQNSTGVAAHEADYLSCTILGGVERFFQDPDGNMTATDLAPKINMWTEEKIKEDVEDFGEMADYDSFGGIALCSDANDCNYYPSDDEVTLVEVIGEYTDDFDNASSLVSQQKDAFGDAVCDRVPGAKSCTHTVRKSLRDSSKKRARRATYDAEMVFSMLFYAGTGLVESDYEALYGSIVDDVEMLGGLAADFISAYSMGEAEAELVPGGGDPADSGGSSPASKPTVSQFLMSTYIVAMTGIVASRWL